MYCALEFGFHQGGRIITSVCSSGVYNNISTATGWRGGRHRDPSDEHRRVILEIRSKELYNTLELDRTARHRIVKEILKAVEPLAKLLGSRLGSVLRFSGVNTHCSGFRLCVLVLKDRRQARRRKPRGSTCFPPSVGTPVGD